MSSRGEAACAPRVPCQSVVEGGAHAPCIAHPNDTVASLRGVEEEEGSEGEGVKMGVSPMATVDGQPVGEEEDVEAEGGVWANGCGAARDGVPSSSGGSCLASARCISSVTGAVQAAHAVSLVHSTPVPLTPCVSSVRHASSIAVVPLLSWIFSITEESMGA